MRSRAFLFWQNHQPPKLVTDMRQEVEGRFYEVNSTMQIVSIVWTISIKNIVYSIKTTNYF